MSGANTSIRDFLYEEPGPKMKKKIAVATIISLAAILFFLYRILVTFYENGQLDAKYWSLFGKATTWRFIGSGIVGTIQVALLAGIIAFALGMLFMLGRISGVKPLQTVSTVFIEFTRGVPTLLFIYFFFLVAPQIGVNLPPFWKITIPVAISASGVVAEVLRSGVNAVPKGQSEAALSLGMMPHSVFFKIVFPQSLRYIVPALIAELVIVVKDTTFAYVVSYPDLMQNAKVLISNYDALVSVYLAAAVIYILINYLLNKASAAVAKRTNTVQVKAR
ncbi:MAG: amino acid ABC transporter permease [Lachnospiraceae bacterium]|nr:amino acid ABC transporter permease [Lachnospiraceae bacterium]